MDYIEFLTFAKSLSHDNEIDIRNAMSRSYYASYHACLLKFLPNNSVEGGLHNKLIQSLKSSPEIKDRTIGFMLEQLKGSRVKADYYLNERISSNESATSIKQTEKLIEKLVK